MTINDIVRELRKYKGQFELIEGQKIRCKDTGECPLAFLCMEKIHYCVSNMATHTFREVLKMPLNRVNMIMDAADHDWKSLKNLSKVRKRLLKA